MYKAYLIGLKSPSISNHSHKEKLTSIINKKTIRYHFNKLIKEHNIFPEKLKPLIAAKHAAKTLFWTAVYLAFSYLTITSTVELIQKYSDNQVTTNMKAMVNSNRTYLPNMTICFKIDIAELFNISSSSSFNYMLAWSRFFEETISPKGIFKVNEGQIYDDEIYLSLLKYLAMIYEAERAWEPGLTQISTFHSEESEDWIALKEVLIPNTERYNITLEQLKSVFSEKLCSLPEGHHSNQLFNLAYGISDEWECIARRKISFMGTDTICFRLIGYKKYLQQLGTTEAITLLPYNDGKDQKWCQEYTVDVGSESRSTPRRATTRNETYAYYYDRFTGRERVEIDIGVKALYRKLPNVKGEIQCSSDTNREECENKCLRGWIRANCHCSPLTFNLTDTSSYRNCTVDDYSICLKKYAENETFLCINKCLALCEQWHYDYDTQASPYTSSNFLKINPYIFDYIMIEQVFTWPSFEEFVGALGGALGIWLGLDFVIIIELIVKLVTKLIKKILLKNIDNSEQGVYRKSVNIKHREENIESGISSSNGMANCVVGNQKKNKETENEIDGTSIRQISESEKQRTSGKKRASNAVKEKYVQLIRKRSSNIRVDSVILNDKMKNIDSNNGRLRNQKVNITNNADAIQDGSTAHANNFNTRSWFLQKVLLLFLNGDAHTNKPAIFLRLFVNLFWAAIYLVGSVFTTLWCVDLINMYLADEAVYFPSLIINRSVSLPPPSLCIPFYFDRLFRNTHSNNSHSLVDYFGQSDINRASFIQVSGGEPWPEPLVSVGLFYFSILAISETDHDNVNFFSKYERKLNLSTGGDTLLSDDIDKSINDILLPKLVEWNVTANELRQKLGAELARMIELKITFTNNNGTTDFVKEASFYTAAITDNLFCYGLSYVVNFTDQEDVLEFSTNRSSYPQVISLYENHVIFSDYLLEPRNAQFEIINGYVSVYNSELFQSLYGIVTRIVISGLRLYTSRPTANGVKYCSLTTTGVHCRTQCRINLIEKLCNCSPTYWATMIQPTSGLDECTFDRYMACLNFHASDDFACKNSCLPFCTARYFHGDQIRHDYSQEYNYTAVVRFSVKDGIYASIEEKPIFTFSDLLIKLNFGNLSLAQLGVSYVIKLGGTLGILLGFNIFSFYQVLMTTATLCFAFILERMRFAQSSIVLKSLDKIKQSGIVHLISELYRQLRIMNICTVKKNIKTKGIGKNSLLAVGYMIGLYATVRMSNDLFCSFKIGEPKYVVDLMMNATITLPSSTICIPVNTVQYLFGTETSHFTNRTNLTRNLYFNSFYDKEEFFNERWPAWLIHWTYEYLIIYDTVERHGNQKIISALFPDNDSYASDESRNTISNHSFTSVMELDELIDRFNITIHELKQNLGQKIRDIYKTTAVFVKEVGGAWNRTVLNITETTFIGKEKICYKLPLDTVRFSSKSDYIFILIDRRSLPDSQNSIDKKSITIDFTGREVSKENYEHYSMLGSVSSLPFGEPALVKLDISEIYEAKPVSSGVRHCSESKFLDRCLDECQQKKIERVCKCSPATRSSYSLSSNLTRCRLIDYKRCAKHLINSDANVCESNCVPQCKRISFKDKPNDDERWIKNEVTNISLTLKSFEYLSIKEVNKYTMTDFMNEFGGILGLWIGLDILAFVDLFYWFVCKSCHIFRQFL